MRPEVRNAIDDVFAIEQDRTSEMWNSTAQSALPGPSGIWSHGDSQAINRAAVALLGLITNKASSITNGTKRVLESYKDFASEREQAKLEQKLEDVLRSDIDHASFVLGAIDGFSANQLIAPRALLQQKGSRDRKAAMHEFRIMLVHERSLACGSQEKPSISIVGSRNVQVGENNFNESDESSRTAVEEVNITNKPEPHQGLLMRWIVPIISATIAAVIAGYLIWRFGWNK